MNDFDVIVVGGGNAAFCSALAAGSFFLGSALAAGRLRRAVFSALAARVSYLLRRLRRDLFLVKFCGACGGLVL